MKNYREEILPNHCGVCHFLDWEELSCYCWNNWIIDDDDIKELVHDWDEEEQTFDQFVDYVYEKFVYDEAEDWHGYNGICDNFIKKQYSEDAKEIEIKNKKELKQRFFKIAAKQGRISDENN